MKLQAVITFMRQRCRNLERQRENLLEEFGVEDIHQFRVEMKRLRAFLRLLNAGREGSEILHIGKKVHSFYKAVGELRGLQIQEQTVLTLCRKLKRPVPHYYLEQLHQMESEAKVMIRKEALQSSFSGFKMRLLNAAHESTSLSTVENFIAIKKYELLKLLALRVYSDEQLHQLRKLLKDFLYVWPLIEEAIAKAFPKQTISEQICLSLTEKLGGLQDLCIALAYFKTADGYNIPREEKAVLETFRCYYENRKATLKERLINQLSELQNEVKKKSLLYSVYEII